MFPAPSKTRELAPALNSTVTRPSFTLPARPAIRSASQPPSTNSSDGIETLFVCSNSKIVSFTTAGPHRRRSPSRASNAGDDTSHSVAWKTPTERTLAVGVLRIYRVTASNVSFLNSGNLLHTIFPRSQCWCVDGQSIFVLRIRQDSYYRIELQYQTQEDRDKIVQFTSVLAQVLQYEKTYCPFPRNFDVDVPERPKTPPRKMLKRQPSQKAKKWLFDKTWVPENGSRPSTSALEGSDAGTTSSYEEDDRSSIHTDSSEVVPESPETVMRTLPPRPVRRLSIAERASIFQGLRSVTIPISTERTASTASMARISELPKQEEQHKEAEKPVLERQASEAASLASSADSFYSLETSTFPTPSPPFLDADADADADNLNPWAEHLPKQDESRGRSMHRRQVSEVTVRGSSADDGSAPVTPTTRFHPTSTLTINERPSSAPSTPPLVDDSDNDSLELPGLDVATPPDAIRMKRLTGASQRRAFSPMPQPKNLFIPPKQNLSRQFTDALVRKTYELVLGPPAHLVSMMLRIAASISNGFGFITYRVRRAEKIPCSWESDDEAEWPEEDDFGIPLNNLGDHAHRRSTFSGELD